MFDYSAPRSLDNKALGKRTLIPDSGTVSQVLPILSSAKGHLKSIRKQEDVNHT